MVEFYDPITKEMMSYHIDKILVEKWDDIRNGKLIEKDEDRVYLVDGRERTGKSVFAFQQAKYIDPNFDIDKICFTPEEFLNQIRNAPKGSVIVFDEAFRGLSSKASRSKVNKAIVEAMMEMGQRNLVVFIVLPVFFLLELYAAALRSEALFHIYATKEKMASGKRKRAFRIYNYKKKLTLYMKGKVNAFSYAFPKTKARGRFFEKYTINEAAYRKKKDESYRKAEAYGEKTVETRASNQRDACWKILNEKYDLTYIKIAELMKEEGFPLEVSGIGVQIRNLREKQKKERLELYNNTD